jgi:hypothetical protein
MQLRSGRIINNHHKNSNYKIKSDAIILARYIENVGGKLSLLEFHNAIINGELKGKPVHSWSQILGYAVKHKYLKLKNDCLYVPSYLSNYM